MAEEKCAHPNCQCDTSVHQAANDQQYCSSYCASEASHASEQCQCGHPDCAHL